MRRWLAGLLTLFTAFSTTGYSEPSAPENRQDVIEILPKDLQGDRARDLRLQLAADPGSPVAASALARTYLDKGRQTSDPRYYGYAEAVLRAFLDNGTADLPLRLLWVDILQFRHDFKTALSVLDELLSQQPDSAQARLERAMILPRFSRFDEARADCRTLRYQAGSVIHAACAAWINSLTGHLEPSYRALAQILTLYPSLDAATAYWLNSLLGDMAVRLDDALGAQRHFHAGLTAKPNDIHLLNATADVLIRAGNVRDALNLLDNGLDDDGLFLRRALAHAALGHQDLARQHIAALQQRYELARLKGDDTHLRDQSHFALHVLHDPETALRLALHAWEDQQTPDNTLAALEAAARAGQPRAAEPVLQWLNSTGLEDARLTPFLHTLRNPTADTAA